MLERKCGIPTCYRVAKDAWHGVPLCLVHLAERAGAGSPDPSDAGLLGGLRRRLRGKSPGHARSKSP
eukprot:7883295-Lingulodinium_polyedra.AAC.1